MPEVVCTQEQPPNVLGTYIYTTSFGVVLKFNGVEYDGFLCKCV